MEAERGYDCSRKSVPPTGSPWARLLSTFARPLHRATLFRAGRRDRVGVTERTRKLSAPTPIAWGWPDYNLVTSGSSGTNRRDRLYPALACMHDEELPGYEAQDSEVFTELAAASVRSSSETESTGLVTDGRLDRLALEGSEGTAATVSDFKGSARSILDGLGSGNQSLRRVSSAPWDVPPAYDSLPCWTRHGQRWDVFRVSARGDNRCRSVTTKVLPTLLPSFRLDQNQILLYDQMSSPVFKKGHAYLKRAFDRWRDASRELMANLNHEVLGFLTTSSAGVVPERLMMSFSGEPRLKKAAKKRVIAFVSEAVEIRRLEQFRTRLTEPVIAVERTQNGRRARAVAGVNNPRM